MNQIKNLTFDLSPWGGLDGFLKATSGGTAGFGKRAAFLKSVVPWLLKANLMISNYTAGLPFDIVKPDGTVVDTSTDWDNAIGGMENPRRLIGLLAGSLCGGSAYLIPERTSKLLVNLQYISSHTITPIIDASGVKGFERELHNGKREKYLAKDMAYFWLPDSDVEIGPPLSSPMSASVLPAELLASMASTMKTYADRGFVPAYLGNAKGMPSEPEKKKAEAYLTQFLRGAYNSVVKIINSESMTLQKVGAGMEEMKGGYTEIQQAAIEDIGTAHGIPAALFMSDKAFASEVNPLLKTMYESSVFVSIYHTIEETFNSQILKQWGYRLQFKPESLSVFQEDENQRANAVSSYASAITADPKVARFVMSFMGVDLDEEQEAELDAIIEDAENKPEPQPVPDGSAVPAEAAPKDKATAPLSADETKELALWYSRAKAWHAKGKGGAVDWENKHLREEIAAPIRLKLAGAKTELDIVKAFEIGETITDSYAYKSEIVILAQAIDRAVSGLIE